MTASVDDKHLRKAAFRALYLHLLLFAYAYFHLDPPANELFFTIQLLESEQRILPSEKKIIQKEIQKQKAETRARQKQEAQSTTTETLVDQNVQITAEDRMQKEFEDSFEKTLLASQSSKTLPSSNASINQASLSDNQQASAPVVNNSLERPGTQDSAPAGEINVAGFPGRFFVRKPKLSYPVDLKQNGIQGEVILSLTVKPSGHIEKVSLSKSSGNLRLDQEAIYALKKAKFNLVPASQEVIVGQLRVLFKVK